MFVVEHFFRYGIVGKNEGAKIGVTKTGEGVRAKNSPSAS